MELAVRYRIVDYNKQEETYAAVVVVCGVSDAVEVELVAST